MLATNDKSDSRTVIFKNSLLRRSINPMTNSRYLIFRSPPSRTAPLTSELEPGDLKTSAIHDRWQLYLFLLYTFECITRRYGHSSRNLYDERTKVHCDSNMVHRKSQVCLAKKIMITSWYFHLNCNRIEIPGNSRGGVHTTSKQNSLQYNE